jgi:hypothetical protein
MEALIGLVAQVDQAAEQGNPEAKVCDERKVEQGREFFTRLYTSGIYGSLQLTLREMKD